MAAIKLCWIFLTLTILGLVASNETSKKVVCYYGSWSVYRPGDGKFDIDNIDPLICTHLIYSFVGLSDSGEINVLDPYLELSNGRYLVSGSFVSLSNFQRFVNVKTKNPNLKIMVAIGGWNEGSVRYSTVFKDSAKRQVFVKSAISFLQKYGFDGLDLDWEYPAQRGGVPVDVKNYKLLIQALRAEFDNYGYLLTAAVVASEASFKQSYDVPALAKYLDFINLMEYDFHGSWEKTTGHNAPLYISEAEKYTDAAQLNVDASVQAWIKYGAPSEKLVLGVGFYGKSFTLVSQNCISPRCPASGAGSSGPYTQEAGMLGYNEICLMVKNDQNAKIMWDNEAQVPYLATGNQWVSYDNEKSAQLKVDYIKKYNLGGAMVWSIETDDFRGVCGNGKYPLLTALKNGMSSDASITTPSVSSTTATPSSTTATPSSTTATPSSTTVTSSTSTPSSTTATSSTSTPSSTTATPSSTTSTTIASVDPSEICKFEGFNRDPNDCAVFYQCRIVNNQYSYSKFSCRNGLVFDIELQVCNYESQVQC